MYLYFHVPVFDKSKPDNLIFEDVFMFHYAKMCFLVQFLFFIFAMEVMPYGDIIESYFITYHLSSTYLQRNIFFF